MRDIKIPRRCRKYNPCLSSAVNKIFSLASVTACAPLTKETAHAGGRGSPNMRTKHTYTTPTDRRTASSDSHNPAEVRR
jgi:hypothetical protein